MKVTCLIDSLGSGGAQRQLCMLAVLLKNRGMDVSVLTYHPFDFFLPNLRAAGIAYACIGSCSLIRRIWSIRRALRRGDQDVVLAFLDAPILYAELAGIPRRRWGLVVSERSAVPLAHRPQLSWRRYLHRTADYVTTNSHTNRLMIERDMPSLKNRTVTIYNAVDLDAFAPRPAPRNGGARRFQIVVAGSYWHIKNPSRFIEGVALARARLPEADICLDWFGATPTRKDGSPDTAVYDEALHTVQSHGLEGCVRLNPDRARIQDAYCGADAVALPSLCEGLPNVVCEGMACGRPVLTGDVCDAGNLVRDGYNGFLFDPTSSESMATAIVQLASRSPEERAVMGANGRKMAECMFAPAAVAEHYERVLRAAAARQRIPLEHWIPDVPESARRIIT
jgi:glycosyltransferase involved in cell wall biosynthesis